MADIARAAGVSRQTLYKEFGSRRSSPRCSSCARPIASCSPSRTLSPPTSTIPSALAAAFEVFLEGAAENPLVHTIVPGDGAEELLTLFTTQGPPLVELATERLTAVMLANWPVAQRQDAELLSECLVRLAISSPPYPKGPPLSPPRRSPRCSGPTCRS